MFKIAGERSLDMNGKLVIPIQESHLLYAVRFQREREIPYWKKCTRRSNGIEETVKSKGL
jgi:hypothetical protein